MYGNDLRLFPPLKNFFEKFEQNAGVKRTQQIYAWFIHVLFEFDVSFIRFLTHQVQNITAPLSIFAGPLRGLQKHCFNFMFLNILPCATSESL